MPTAAATAATAAPATARVTLGFTLNDRANDYFPAADGHRSGARQHQITLDLPLDLLAGLTPSQIAEACFTGSNLRGDTEHLSGQDLLVQVIARRLLPVRQRSLSVGDTVSFGDTFLECAGFGWKDA